MKMRSLVSLNDKPEPGCLIFFAGRLPGLFEISFFPVCGQTWHEARFLDKLAFNCSIKSFVGECTTFNGWKGVDLPFAFALMIFISLLVYSSLYFEGSNFVESCSIKFMAIFNSPGLLF